jgi:hypothetical protein
MAATPEPNRRRRQLPQCGHVECEETKRECEELRQALHSERQQFDELFFHAAQSPYRHFLFFTRDSVAPARWRYRARCRLCEEHRIAERGAVGGGRIQYQAALRPHNGWNVDGGPHRQRSKIDQHFLRYHKHLFKALPAPPLPHPGQDDAGDNKDSDDEAGDEDGGGGGRGDVGDWNAGGQPWQAPAGYMLPVQPLQPQQPPAQFHQHHGAARNHYHHHHVHGGRAPTAALGAAAHAAQAYLSFSPVDQGYAEYFYPPSDAPPGSPITQESMTVPASDVRGSASASDEASENIKAEASSSLLVPTAQPAMPNPQGAAVRTQPNGGGEEEVEDEEEESEWLPVNKLSLE